MVQYLISVFPLFCAFFFYFLQFTQDRHQHDEVFLLHVFNSFFRSHSESRFSTSACFAKDFYDARHPYYTYIYIFILWACFQSFGGDSSNWMFICCVKTASAFIETLQITCRSVGSSAKQPHEPREDMHSMTMLFQNHFCVKGLERTSSNRSVAQRWGRKKQKSKICTCI